MTDWWLWYFCSLQQFITPYLSLKSVSYAAQTLTFFHFVSFCLWMKYLSQIMVVDRYVHTVLQSRSQKGLVKVNNASTFDINPMLLQNISKSSYFQKCCKDLSDWNKLVDEIFFEVKSLEPWSNGKSKSWLVILFDFERGSDFCLLLLLLLLLLNWNIHFFLRLSLSHNQYKVREKNPFFALRIHKRFIIRY